MLNNKNVTAVFDPENQEWRARCIADSQFRCHCGSTVAEVIELTEDERRDSSWALHGVRCYECGMRYAIEPRADTDFSLNRAVVLTVARLHPLRQVSYVDVNIFVSDEEQKHPDKYGNTTAEAKNLAKLVDRGLINFESENN